MCSKPASSQAKALDDCLFSYMTTRTDYDSDLFPHELFSSLYISTIYLRENQSLFCRFPRLLDTLCSPWYTEDSRSRNWLLPFLIRPFSFLIRPFSFLSNRNMITYQNREPFFEAAQKAGVYPNAVSRLILPVCLAIYPRHMHSLMLRVLPTSTCVVVNLEGVLLL